jgi:hypothetical protein
LPNGTDRPTPTPTATATPPACTGTPVAILLPSGGVKDAGTLVVDASHSTDPCGRPLRYFWSCVGTEGRQCDDFMIMATDGTVASHALPLEDGDVYIVALFVCVDGGTICSDPQLTEYQGQATF